MLKTTKDLAKKDLLCQINQLINSQIYIHNPINLAKKDLPYQINVI